MNFLLKIVEGPNKGAEIALVEGVAVTFGKNDSCDIVLADTTLPEEPVTIAAGADGVTVGGEPLEPLQVKTFGATSLAVGPADSPWGDLVWPQAEAKGRDLPDGDGKAAESAAGEDDVRRGEEETPAAAPSGNKRRGGCLGCFAAIVLVLIALAALGWFFRDKASPYVEKARPYAARGWSFIVGKMASSDAAAATVRAVDLSDIAAKYGLTLEKNDGDDRLYGNLRTRRERLSATAEAYDAQPGVELDLTDDESLRTAAEDALFTLTEGALKVVAATNRVVALAGASNSPFWLKRVVDALNADMPKLRHVDVSGVVIDPGVSPAAVQESAAAESPYAPSAVRAVAKSTAKAGASMPVCGILTTPYPCLVMKNGARLLEGAAFGDSVILKIEADSVTLTNSTGRFTWKP